jgi:[acyl-carrier-protein] S-malonyltransferase
MSPAKAKLKDYLNNMDICPNIYPYIANVDAEEYPVESPADTIKENLIEQLTSGVMWTQSVRKLEDGIPCIEVGPGKVLSALIKKINPRIGVYLATDLEGLVSSECTLS